MILDLQLTPGPAEIPAGARGGAVSVGNFDGVHRGHAALLSELVRAARRSGGPAVVVTFDPHPVALLRPGREPARLTTPQRRAELLADLGVDYVAVCQTSLELLRLTADAFFEWLVVDTFAARAMVEGPNFYFGRDRGGTPQRLAELCDANAIALKIVSPTRCDTVSGQSTAEPTRAAGSPMVSSSRIRQLLSSGQIGEANALLTAPYRIRGTVVSGDRRGRELGFPTANLTEIASLIPASGVYASRTRVGTRWLPSATHIGPNLTFDAAGERRVETHLIGFEGDLYGKSLDVELVERIRGITRFDSAEALVTQMQQDVAAAERLVEYL